MGFMQRKRRPHVYRDPSIPWPHETYLEKKAERAAAATTASVVALPSPKAKALKPAKPAKRVAKRK